MSVVSCCSTSRVSCDAINRWARDGDEGDRHWRASKWLRTPDIGVNLLFELIHLQPYYQWMSFRRRIYLVSGHYAQQVIALQYQPSQTEACLGWVADTIAEALAK